MIRFRRDFHLHPLVLLKLVICKLRLAAVFDLVEFCHRCGRRVNQVWWTDAQLWREAVGNGDAGVRCIPCFDRECLDRGLLVRWTPVVEARRSAQGQPFAPTSPEPAIGASLNAEAHP